MTTSDQQYKINLVMAAASLAHNPPTKTLTTYAPNLAHANYQAAGWCDVCAREFGENWQVVSVEAA